MKSYLPYLILGLILVGFAAQARGTGTSASVSATPCTSSCPMPAMPGMPQMQGMSVPAGPAEMTMGPHMKMLHSSAHPTQQDLARADAILAALRATMARYQDYRIAERDGYVQFLAQVPQPIYHFTNWTNAKEALAGFDPAKPTSLMYKTVPGGYQLVGAMYTAPASASLADLNARVPLTVGTWHEHVNVCFPPPGMGWLMLMPHAKYGLAGSIATSDACAAAGGSFKPLIFNWMLHVWPYETSQPSIWKATTD